MGRDVIGTGGAVGVGTSRCGRLFGPELSPIRTLVNLTSLLANLDPLVPYVIDRTPTAGWGKFEGGSVLVVAGIGYPFLEESAGQSQSPSMRLLRAFCSFLDRANPLQCLVM